jgi:BirA family biotin operon repressor/biotin-[acetyl-CoA-carboxylase] ligase
MKSRILDMLRSSGETVSGEVLSESLGISRVSVWKHVRKLQAAGYQITAGSRGYRLDGEPDVPYPWEFPEREHRMHHFDAVDSTMDIARELARDDCPPYTVVVAESQRKGRGRLRRDWHSEAGGLYVTVVLRPELPPALSTRVIFTASVELCRTLEHRYNLSPRVKWPNDILVEERKICGMLSEMEAEADRVSYLNIGIGLNVNNDPTREGTEATSLRRLLGGPVGRKALLAEFLDRFEARLEEGATNEVMSAWKRRSGTLNRPVRVATRDRVYEGLAVDIDDDGALRLRLSDGSEQRVIHGDCFHN